MANLLDEMNPQTMDEGRDINVITKQIPVQISSFENLIPTIFMGLGALIGVIGLISLISTGESSSFVIILIGAAIAYFTYKKLKSTESYLYGLEQKINAYASEIDNYMEQRVQILRNASALIEKSIDLDKEVFIDLAKYRSGNFTDAERSQVDMDLRRAERNIQVALENYPQLQSQQAIIDGMQQNSYLQREITASRSTYNDAVYQWNREIFEFPFKKIVAARQGRTTRIPFIASKETKEEARGVFF